MKKNWLSWFVYISVIFLVITLVRNDYIFIPEQLSYLYFALSIFLLFSGFILQGLSYKILLKKYGYSISARDSLVAFGITILSRYVPGKFWIHLGRGGYVNERYGYPFGEMVYISLYSQFLGMWNAIFLCLIGLWLTEIELYLKLLVLALWLFLSIVIFTRYLHKFAQKVVYKILKKEFSLPTLTFRKNLAAFPVFLIFWALYGAAFYFLALSMNLELKAYAMIYFPLATIIGIAAVFAPGGLGLREASLVGMLTLGNISTAHATTLTVFSRVWYLAGELFAFALSIILKHRRNKTGNQGDANEEL